VGWRRRALSNPVATTVRADTRVLRDADEGRHRPVVVSFRRARSSRPKNTSAPRSFPPPGIPRIVRAFPPRPPRSCNMFAACATSATAAALRAPSGMRRSRAPSQRAAPRFRCQASPETGHVGYDSVSPARGASSSIATRVDLAPANHVGSLRRAREILAIDPSAKNALDLVGTKVNMTCRFTLHYETRLGEDLFLIGSHERLGAWAIECAAPMRWTEGNVWTGDVELPASGVFFYKYVVKMASGQYRWQDGANNLLALPDPWDVPDGSVFVVDDQFGGLTKEAQNQLAVKLIMTEKEKVGLKVEASKAKEMTKAALQELLLAREELRAAHEKLAAYEANAAAVFTENGANNQR
jgi:hypothetical protein